MRDNVEALRRYHEILNDRGVIAVEFLDPDVEMKMFRGSPIPGPYHGHEGARRWREDPDDSKMARFEGYRERAEALGAVGIDHVT